MAQNKENTAPPAGWTTLGHEAHIEFTERKSVFLGHAKPVESEAEALEFIKRIRHEYADATHNVYAYLLRSGGIARYSDDGEPQGTAGIPVLDVIRKRGFADAVIVVTRYFGGILLGAGGLVRAYGNAARMAADEAGIVTFLENVECELRCDYGAYQRIAAELPFFGAAVTASDFTQDVRLTLVLRATEYPRFADRMRELTAGKYLPRELRRFFGA